MTETAEYDDRTREFSASGFIPLEDGVNDETVRTAYSLNNPNKIVHRHFSRRCPKETCERMDDTNTRSLMQINSCGRVARLLAKKSSPNNLTLREDDTVTTFRDDPAV